MFAISGFSGTGKTSLIEQIMRELRNRGYSASVIKSSNEDVGPPKGTDTFRHLKASADPVVLLGPNTTTIRYQNRMKSEDLFSRVDADFALLEGFKSISVPRIFCIGKRGFKRETIPPETYGIVTWKNTEDTDTTIEVPIIQSNNIELVVDLIVKHAVNHVCVRF